MTECTVLAYAKLNLFLDITGTLPDGYHSIYTVMQSVDLHDTITVSDTDQGIELICDAEGFPLNEKNTQYKAASLFLQAAGIHRGVRIATEKRVPMQAGLAGGSADAAAVLTAMSQLYDEPLTKTQLLQIAEEIGADVPFCLTGGTRLCLNRGEIMAELPPLPDCHFLIVRPNQPVATAAAYSAFDAASWIRSPDREGFLYAVKHRDLELISLKATNVFEQVVDVSNRARIKSVMRRFGADMSMMTGSGSAIFGLFRAEDAANQCAEALRKEYENVFVCKPVLQGCRISSE